MSDEISLNLTKEDGSTEQERVRISRSILDLFNRQLVAVSDNVAQLTRMAELRLWSNAFTEIPSGMLTMTQLTWLSLSNNRLVTLPREIGRLTALQQLILGSNKLTSLPREIGRLVALSELWLSNNALTSLPAELGQLSSLEQLLLRQNSLTWLPSSLNRLPTTTKIFLNGNPLPIDVGDADAFPLLNSRPKLPELFAATTALSMIREEATTLAIGLQDLSLPALVTLEIVDAAFPNSIPMHLKWNLITAIKHFQH